MTFRFRRGEARAFVGALFVIRTTALANLHPNALAHIHGPLLGWPEPGWRVGWLDLVLPDAVVMAAAVVRTLAGLAFALGLFTRASGLIAAGAAFVVASQDPFGFYFTLYALYLSVAILAITDAGASFAVRPSASTAPRSSAQLVIAFVASIYFWSGLAKLRAGWLNGDSLRAYVEDGLLRGPLVTAMLGTNAPRIAAAWTTVAVELALAPLLLWERTRTAAVVIALAMHVVYEATLHPDVFGWLMVALLLSTLVDRQRLA